MRNRNPMCVPVVTGRSVMKSTPLADTFTVTAANSSPSVDRATGRLKGNRTAQRTSCRGAMPMRVGETVNPGVDGFIPHNPSRKQYQYCTSRLTRTGKHQSFFHLAPMYPLFTNFGMPLPCHTFGAFASSAKPQYSAPTSYWNFPHYAWSELLLTLWLIYFALIPRGTSTVIRSLPPKCRRSPHPLLVPVVVYAHHLSSPQADQRQHRRQLAPIRP